MHVFGLLEEVGEPTENLQAAHKRPKPGIKPTTFLPFGSITRTTAFYQQMALGGCGQFAEGSFWSVVDL